MACVGYLVAMNVLNAVPVDIGDGIQHFSIAQISWADPAFLLDHWGKPLFTLFASPFAQFGFKAYVSFDILVFLLTCLIAFRLFKHAGCGLSFYYLFPVLLLCVPDYTYCVLGGMTEPFFGLIIVALVYCGWREHWILFAVIASFAPFARSEGMLVVILGIVFLLLNKQWKSLPLLFTGFVLYAVIGWFAFGSFWWFFELDPYPETSVYGSGNWSHYLVNMDDHTGVLTLLVLPFAIVGWILYQRKNACSRTFHVAIFAMVIYAGVVLIHSYLWAYGLKGSLGLTRIATLGLPGLMLVLLIGASFWTRQLSFRWRAILLLLICAGIAKEFTELKYPITPNPLEKLIFRAVDYSKKAFKSEKVYYMSPLVAWKAGENVKDPDSRFRQFYFHADSSNIAALETGSIVIRDPVFGPVEQGLPLEFIQNHPELVEIKTFSSDEVYPLYTKEPLKIHIYRVVRKS